VPQTVEFWQASTTREHTRLRYERRENDWFTDILVP